MEMAASVLLPHLCRLLVIKENLHDDKKVIVAWIIKEPVTFVFYSSAPW